ncbi:MAG: DUF7453 family protein [Acidimicrobiia bacterium]
MSPITAIVSGLFECGLMGFPVAPQGGDGHGEGGHEGRQDCGQASHRSSSFESGSASNVAPSDPARGDREVKARARSGGAARRIGSLSRQPCRRPLKARSILASPSGAGPPNRSRSPVGLGAVRVSRGGTISRTFRTAFVLLLAATTFAALAAAAGAQSFQFRKIVDSGQGLTPDGCPAVNDLGQVAFKAVDETGEQAVYRASPGGALTTIATETPAFDFIGRNPSLNELGQVSFAATLEDEGEAILVGRGGALREIARTEPGPFNFFGFDTSLSNLGRVAFTAELDDFDEGLFVGGPPLRTVYLASSSPFLGTLARPSLNDLGQVAFEEARDDFSSGIFLATGNGFTTIVDDSGPVGFATDPKLNLFGLVAFAAFLDDGESAIMTGRGGPLRTVASSTGEFAFFDGRPALNDLGFVAFSAALDSGQSGVFLGTRAVILTGQSLDGSVTNAFVCSEGLSTLGRIAFVAQLEDGRTAIFVARPDLG